MTGGGDAAANEGTVDVDPALVEQVRARLECDGLVIRGTDRKTRPEVLRRAATLAVEELTAGPNPPTWETARTRPLATPELDDPRDVLIGRLAGILGVADGGHHFASYNALISAAHTLKARASTETL